MKSISSKAAFWIVACVLAISLWSQVSPSIAFPVYASQWHLSPSITTGIFATFSIALILVLVLFGNISDYIGRRNTLITGLIFLLIGALAFALASNMYWLFAGRVLQGIGAGLTSSSGPAALAEFNPTSNKKLPGSVTITMQSVGMFLATIIGGALIKYGPSPLHLNYWVLSSLVFISIILSFFLPQNKTPESARKSGWKPQGVKVPSGLWGLYVLAALAAGIGQAYVAVFSSLGAQIARDVVGTKDILVIGTVLSIGFLLSAVSGAISGRLSPVTSIRIGMVSIILTMVLLVTASELHSFVIFVISTILGGLAAGFSIAGGIGIAIINSPPQYRVQFLSAVYLVVYLFQASSSYGGGVASTAYGFSNAIWSLTVIFGFVALITLLLTMKNRKETEPAPAAPNTTR
jgi:MFS family permease